jgi:hypothetical protein
VAQAERAGRVPEDERAAHQSGLHQRLRFVGDRPLNASHTALRGTFIACGETTADGQGPHGSGVTALWVNTGTGDRLMRGARARWRIANETVHTLQKQGSQFEHNVGHGYHHLAVVFAPLMRVAFFVEQGQQLCCPLAQVAWAKWGSKRLLWEKRRAFFYAYTLESRRYLFEALYYGLNKSASALTLEACS